MAGSLGRRALHFVFKIGNRQSSIDFYTKVLGMKVLRHEEFEGGCGATCNGPYDGAWSKTMIGYGPEDDHFVIELTYNYGISSYKKGNDFDGLTVEMNAEQLALVRAAHYPSIDDTELLLMVSPCGYKFFLQKTDTAIPRISEFKLAVSNLASSTKYWRELGLQLSDAPPPGNRQVQLQYPSDQAKLTLRESVEPIDRGSAFGRVAFSCPTVQLKGIQAVMEDNKSTILTPYLSLDTPGKASVVVVILADPDGHEICFVGDEGFRELSQVDPKAMELLEEAIKKDKSAEWFKEHGIDKKQM